MNESIIYDKGLAFAQRIVRVYKVLTGQRKEYVMSKQLLRSGTSIGANVSEAIYAQSRPDFIHKMSIALKEAHETEYWLKLLYSGEYFNEKEYFSLETDVKEIIKILITIVKTSKANGNEQLLSNS